MNKVYQMWYLLFIYYDFATVVNPFFRAVQYMVACTYRISLHYARPCIILYLLYIETLDSVEGAL